MSPFGLAISLGVVCGAVQQLGAHACKELLPKAAHETCIPVSNDFRGHTEGPDHPLQEQVSSLGCSDGIVHGD